MEWGDSRDLLTDLLMICEFSSPENSIDLEINQNIFLDESSNDTEDTEESTSAWREAPAEDNSERLMNEVAEDLRRLKGVGVYSEDDSPFLRHSKVDEAEESYVTALSESETESSNVSSYKTANSDTPGSSYNSSSSPATTAKRPRRKTRFRPLQETSAYLPAEKFDWHPVEEGKGFSKTDFPLLK